MKDEHVSKPRVEHVIRVTAESTGMVSGVVDRTWTLEEALQAAYNWGHTDGSRAAEGRPLYGEDDDWSVVGTPLKDLRAGLTGARRDG